MKKYYYNSHYLDSNDISTVIDSLKRDTLSQGSYQKLLEEKIKKRFNVKYCIAVSSATAGLHLAYKSLGLKKNDYIITSTMTWNATTNAAIFCNATSKLVDISEKNFCIDPKKLENFIIKAKKKPKIIVPVHFGASLCNLRKISQIAKKFKIRVVEDASQAMGASYGKNIIGSCKYSDVTIFSLHPVKTITSGEGGLVLTNSYKIFKEVKLMRSHSTFKSIKKEPWSTKALKIGFNYRITEMQCALAYSQLKKLDKFLNKRSMIRKEYMNQLKDYIGSIEFQEINHLDQSSNHMMIIKFNSSNFNLQKKYKIYDFFRKNNIYLTTKYYPLHNQYPFFLKKKYPKSEEYYLRTFCFPIYYNLKKKEIIYTTNLIKKAINIFKLHV